MSEPVEPVVETPMTLEVGHLPSLMLDQLAQHQKTRPFDPDTTGCPPDYEVARMDEWQRMDSAIRLVIGANLTQDAWRQWQKEGRA